MINLFILVKMKVNNFEHFKTYFGLLEDRDHFFFVQVLRRKKDDGQAPNFHVIRNYYIYSVEQFEKYIPGIIELCESNNARAYFWVNPRDAKQIALETSKALINHVINKTVTDSYKTYDHICGKTRCNQYAQLWVVDVDDRDKVLEIVNAIPADKVFDMIETAKGFHIITYKFNTQEFHNRLQIPIDIHKDNPTLLYYAENERESM